MLASLTIVDGAFQSSMRVQRNKIVRIEAPYRQSSHPSVPRREEAHWSGQSLACRDILNEEPSLSSEAFPDEFRDGADGGESCLTDGTEVSRAEVGM